MKIRKLKTKKKSEINHGQAYTKIACLKTVDRAFRFCTCFSLAASECEQLYAYFLVLKIAELILTSHFPSGTSSTSRRRLSFYSSRMQKKEKKIENERAEKSVSFSARPLRGEKNVIGLRSTLSADTTLPPSTVSSCVINIISGVDGSRLCNKSYFYVTIVAVSRPLKTKSVRCALRSQHAFAFVVRVEGVRGRTRVRNNVHEYDNIIIICHRNEEEKQNVTNSEIYKRNHVMG